MMRENRAHAVKVNAAETGTHIDIDIDEVHRLEGVNDTFVIASQFSLHWRLNIPLTLIGMLLDEHCPLALRSHSFGLMDQISCRTTAQAAQWAFVLCTFTCLYYNAF